MIDILTIWFAFITGLITGMTILLSYVVIGETIATQLCQGWDTLINRLRPKPFAYVVIMG